MKDKSNSYRGSEKKGSVNKKMLTLFLIMFPSILIAGNYGAFSVNLVIKAALIFYQFVLLKAFLEDYYKLLQ